MEEQPENDEHPNKPSAVKTTLQKLKEKFVPTVKYSLLISGALNFSMLLIGCLNVHKCPVDKYIPLFLIVEGAVGLISKFVSYVRNGISKYVQVWYIESALYCVESVFFFLGTYWVYKEFQPSYNSEDGNLYCNKTAYLFAFIYITFFYALVITIALGFCCFLCCSVWLLSRTSSYDVEGQPETLEAAEALAPQHETTPKP